MLVDIARLAEGFKVRKTARIRNRLEGNKITINITNKSQEVSPFPSGDHKAAMNRRQSMANTMTQMINKRSTALELSVNVLLEGLNLFHGVPTSLLVQIWIKTHRCLVCMKDP